MNRKNMHGNNTHLTYNVGHDTAKTRLQQALDGYNIYEIRSALEKHPVINRLKQAGKVRIGKIIGQNFTIGCVSEVYNTGRAVNSNGQTVVQVVNNIADSVLAGFGFAGYGKTQFWEVKQGNKYPNRIRFGADIVSYNWIVNNYSRSEFTKKLSERQQIKKYRG